ncbi:MFS transporter [Comamonas piscis]|uniref:MFS transporter n=1 Tax=Comamonas piscis TaxID=1562974 RepID=A0A7G5EJ93_9BURK|nr:MFS transporter [Comamonas piscis]QMV74068.1 MFS transporter [Comamonas piscis]WSO32502.1 MFS transporter [Comamonas piscis]
MADYSSLSSHPSPHLGPSCTPQSGGLPLASLLALALAGFVTILTEALPAGLLPQISAGLGVSQAMAGQLVSLYAIGSLVAAIPLTAATQRMRRKPLLLAALAGFVLANTMTTFSGSYALTLLARLVAGVAAGLLWALLAGYATRMVPPHQSGRAIAMAMLGAPLALSLGLPLGTWMGQHLGWRLCFGSMSVLALLLMAWVQLRLPDFSGQPAGQAFGLGQVFRLPGVRPVLLVVLAYVLAHNLLYTYIAPLLAPADLGGQIDRVLLVFGLMSVLSIWITGLLIDRHLRALSLASTGLFLLGAVLLALAMHLPTAVYLAVAVWGLGFGGLPPLLQTALAKSAGPAADVAQSMLVTSWNLAIAGGGIAGGLLLAQWGVAAFSPAVLLLMLLSLAVVLLAKRHGFAAAQP